MCLDELNNNKATVWYSPYARPVDHASAPCAHYKPFGGDESKHREWLRNTEAVHNKLEVERRANAASQHEARRNQEIGNNEQQHHNHQLNTNNAKERSQLEGILQCMVDALDNDLIPVQNKPGSVLFMWEGIEASTNHTAFDDTEKQALAAVGCATSQSAPGTNFQTRTYSRS